MWVVGETVVCKQRQYIEVVLEVCDLDRDGDLVIGGGNVKAIPKSEKASWRALSGSVGSSNSRNA